MSGIRFSRRIVYAAAVATLMNAAAAHADTLVTSFETGGFDYPGDATVSYGTLSTVGVTDGSYSLHVWDAAQNWWEALGYLNIDPTALAANTNLEFDVTTSTGVQFVPIFHNDPTAGQPGSGGWNQGSATFVGASPNPQTVVIGLGSFNSGSGLPAASTYTLQLQNNTGNAVNFYIDNVRLVGTLPQFTGDGQWALNGSGDWMVAANWNGGIPGNFGDTATFGTNGGAITTASQIVVNTQQLTSPSTMVFDKGGGGYKIGGTFPLSVSLNVNVVSGNQEIAAPLTMGSGASISIASGSSLKVDNLTVSGYGQFTAAGPGTLSVDKIQNCSLAVTNGAALNFLAGNQQNNGWMYDINVGSTSTANFGDAVITNNSLNGAGTIITNGQITTGQFLSSGGNPGSYYFNGTLLGTGSVVLGGGTLTEMSNTEYFTGTVGLSGGITLNSGSLNTTGLGSGTVTINAGTVTVTAQATPNTNASKIAGLTMAATGTHLDLTNNSLIVVGAGSTVDAIRQQLAAGTIASSLADATHKLGYGNNAVLGKTTFAGQSVGPTDLLIKYTYGGDANLDGQVDVTDLGALATNWQTSAPWTGGDFNYDGFVDVTDLGILATNWQAGVGAPLGPGSLQQALAAFGLGGAAVPEPATLAFFACGLVFAAARRRRPIANRKSKIANS